VRGVGRTEVSGEGVIERLVGESSELRLRLAHTPQCVYSPLSADHTDPGGLISGSLALSQTPVYTVVR